jgi:hypothetical protein
MSDNEALSQTLDITFPVPPAEASFEVWEKSWRGHASCPNSLVTIG